MDEDAMENAEQGTAAQTAEHQRLLAEASRVLAASLDYPTGLTHLVRLLVPDLADWCIIDVVAEDGALHRLAIAHADAAKEEVVRQLQRRDPILHPQGTYTILKVLRTGQAWIDTGPGIPAELQTRIFEPFFTTKPGGIGTGLGLSLCRGIIEEHGGTITMHSQPGQGTSFLVEVPVGMAPTTAAEPSMIAEPSPGQGQTILIVDDEVGIRNALTYLLHRDGYKVDTAGNGRLALAKLQEKAFDVVLCDLRMPELDGPAVHRELERHQPQLLRCIIFLTGDTMGAETREFLDQTGVPRLSKPFTTAEARRAGRQALQIS